MFPFSQASLALSIFTFAQCKNLELTLAAGVTAIFLHYHHHLKMSDIIMLVDMNIARRPPADYPRSWKAFIHNCHTVWKLLRANREEADRRQPTISTMGFFFFFFFFCYDFRSCHYTFKEADLRSWIHEGEFESKGEQQGKI
ncbi:unnamed protein product [Lactuca saligna]|uniref:Uncharacterized protein n=1 Tax=Lactuca saligna TaxID=75948 RepID=A0AA36A0W3_LACSI|nr:unnamed protein product [Lactuca saligna]